MRDDEGTLMDTWNDDTGNDDTLAHMMSARLCHDLVGAAGGITAGLDVLGDDLRAGGGVSAAEALGLLRGSSEQINGRLAFFRRAFGRGNDSLTPGEGGALLGAYLRGGRVALDWEVGEGDGWALPAAGARLMLNLGLAAVAALGRGGTLTARFALLSADRGGLGMALSAEGAGARLADGDTDILLGRAAPAPTPRDVPAHLAAREAKRLGVDIELAMPTPGMVQMAVVLPTMPAAPA
ncbi:MAG: hypothetical protein KDE22_08355 [Rhodobacterales bacterium]|nr:hypothetical protein [Rhodobacterales bacterium]